MLDYALRRRFAFFEMTPAFNSSGFRAYRAKINNPKFDRLIATVEQLNDVIANDDSLGEGFASAIVISVRTPQSQTIG